MATIADRIETVHLILKFNPNKEKRINFYTEFGKSLWQNNEGLLELFTTAISLQNRKIYGKFKKKLLKSLKEAYGYDSPSFFFSLPNDIISINCR